MPVETGPRPSTESHDSDATQADTGEASQDHPAAPDNFDDNLDTDDQSPDTTSETYLDPETHAAARSALDRPVVRTRLLETVQSSLDTADIARASTRNALTHVNPRHLYAQRRLAVNERKHTRKKAIYDTRIANKTRAHEEKSAQEDLWVDEASLKVVKKMRRARADRKQSNRQEKITKSQSKYNKELGGYQEKITKYKSTTEGYRNTILDRSIQARTRREVRRSLKTEGVSRRERKAAVESIFETMPRERLAALAELVVERREAIAHDKEAHKSLSRQTKNYEALASQIEAAHAEAAHATQEAQRTSARLDTLRSAASGLEQDLATKRAALETMQDGAPEDIQALEAEIAAVEIELESKLARIGEESDRLAMHQQIIARHQQRIPILENNARTTAAAVDTALHQRASHAVHVNNHTQAVQGAMHDIFNDESFGS